MEIDVRTLVMVLGLTHLMQVLVFYHQYRINKTYPGIGWWLLWSAAESAGFVALLLRGIPHLLPVVIIVQNLMIVSGTVFLYVGIRRFFNKPVNTKLLITILTVFTAGLLFFLFVIDNIQIRSGFISAVLAIMAFLTMHSLLVSKTRSFRAAANFNAIIFCIHGGIFVYRTIMIFAGTPVDSIFTPTLFNILPYFDALIVSLLWTFGLIIMLNQRLNTDVLEAKEELQSIFNTSPDAALITRLDDGLIADVNDGYTNITGFTRDEMIGKKTTEVNIWKNNDDRQIVVNQLKSQGFCENFEAQFILKNGTEITGLMSAKITELHGVPNIISITRNITERKRMEKELQESELRFRLLFENMSEGVAMHEMIYNEAGISVDYRLVDVNKAFEEFTGISALRACGTPACELYGVSSPPYLAEYIDVVGNKKTLSFETYFKEMNKFFSISAICTKPGCFATIFLDITERKRKEAELDQLLETSERSRNDLLSILEDQMQVQEALSESERKFREIIINLDEGYYNVTLDGILLEHNQAFSRILGFDDSVSLKGRYLPDFWQNPNDRHLYVKKLIVDGAISNYYINAKNQTGEKIILLASAHLVRDKENKPLGIEGVFLDITERIRTEKEITRLNEELEQRVLQRTTQLEAANKELEAFSYSVSHDLRAPLRHIGGFVELLTSRFKDNLPEKAQHYLGNISDSIGQMGVLIDELLKFSRTGRMELVKKELEMQEVFNRVLQEIIQANPGRAIKWNISVLPRVYGDDVLLQIVWNNLLANALKYSRNREEAKIEVRVQEEKTEFIFSIQDNGVGFDMQYAQKLYGVFQRLHPASEFEGTGIGLANVQRIILRHGGRTWAEAEIDMGATFFFTLPKH